MIPPDEPRTVPPAAAPTEARGEHLDRVLSRRRALQGAAAVGGLFALRPPSLACAAVSPRSTLRFPELGARLAPILSVAEGHRAQVLLRQGEPLLAGASDYVPGRVDAAAQARAFGSGNDFLAFLPLPLGSDSSDHGLLFCNHEMCHARLQFPALPEGGDRAAQDAAERASVGASVAEVRLANGTWTVVSDSAFARRITGETPIRLSGPAAGHPRLRTAADPKARTVLGTLGNCAGGVTPWGTVLTAEENVTDFFQGSADAAEVPERRSIERMQFGYTVHRWGDHEPRFDLAQEPREANRFGWIVEVDPFDPEAAPVKRTALGRFRHEGATTALAPDGRVVVYMGDDTRGEYLYRFVSADAYDPEDREANRDLLDEGTLSVADFQPDGGLIWRPLAHGTGPLSAENGFESQADVVIEARRAADLLGATPLDRCEDVKVQPGTGRVYAALTNNHDRGQRWPVDGPNPRADNVHGQVLELRPPAAESGVDHAAERFEWDVFLLAGDPRRPEHGATVHPETTRHGWFSCPDNLAFDPAGRLWIATDGNEGVNGRGDGLFACDTEGEGRALVRHFLSVPMGAEACGPCFTPDGRTLFLAIQHPGAGRGSSFAEPRTRWPDFADGVPPRDAVVAVRRDDGEPIG